MGHFLLLHLPISWHRLITLLYCVIESRLAQLQCWQSVQDSGSIPVTEPFQNIFSWTQHTEYRSALANNKYQDKNTAPSTWEQESTVALGALWGHTYLHADAKQVSSLPRSPFSLACQYANDELKCWPHDVATWRSKTNLLENMNVWTKFRHSLYNTYGDI